MTSSTTPLRPESTTPRASRTTRYIVDITTMANYFGRVTGITRTEREIARHFLKYHPEDTRLIYWSNDKRVFEEYRGLLDFEAVKAARMSRDFAINKLGFGDFRMAAPNEGSTPALIVSGSGWLQNQNYLLGCIGLARSHTMRLSIYLHDLIPALFPYFYSNEYVTIFLQNLRIIATSGALIACNSRNTEKDFLEWCAKEGLDAPTTCIAYLGDDFELPTSQADTALPLASGTDLPNIMAGAFVLAVGAVHRRKNYELLLPVWRRLAAQMGNKCPTLVIAGGITSEGKVLEAEINADPVLRRLIKILPAVTDTELTALYQSTALVVYPSLYEGWGLPVAEALAHGRVCLASRGSAITEIADLGEDLLLPDDVPGWTSRIQFYLNSARARTEREAALRQLYRPRRWVDTIAKITDALENLPATDAPTLFLGDTVQFNTPASRLLLIGPTYGVEGWGTWVRGDKASIQFGFDTSEQTRGATLQLKLQLPGEMTLKVHLNDQNLGHFTGPTGPACYSMMIPEGLLQRFNVLHIRASNMVTLPDKPLKPWAARTTGVGLINMSLFSRDQVLYEHAYRQTLGCGLISLSHHAPAAIRLSKPPFDDKIGQPAHLALYLVCSRLPRIPAAERNDAVKGHRHLLDNASSRTSCLVLAKVEARGTAHLTIRQNGVVVHNDKIRIRNGGILPIWIDLTCSDATDDYPDFEMFLFDAERMQQIKLELISIFAPVEQFDLPVARILQGLPVLSVNQFHKFGNDSTNAPTDIFCVGWTLARSFGVETEGGAAMIAALSENLTPITRLKLNCKLSYAGTNTVTFLLNGQTHQVELNDEIRTVYLDFPKPLENGSLISLVVWLDNAQSHNEVVLRSLQLL